MKKKSVISCIFAALILLPGTSCSSAPAGTPEDSTSAPDTTPITEAPQVYYLDELSDRTFDGVTFSMVGESTEQRPNFCEEEYTGVTINDAVYERQMALESRYGISVEYYPQTSRNNAAKTVNNAVQSDDDTYDLVFNAMVSSGMSSIATAGSLTELSALPHLHFEKDHWAQRFVENMTVGGKLFYAAGGTSPSYYLSAVACFFNVEKAKEYQLPDLYSLVLDGKWTLDTMSGLLSQCKSDLNGDGAIRVEDDFLGLVHSAACGPAYFMATGGQMIEKDESGTFYLNLNSALNIDLLGKLRAVYGNTTDIYTIPDSLTKGKIGSFVNQHTMFAVTAMMFAAQELREMSAAYGVLPLPKLDENQQDYITGSNSYAPCGTGIPRSATDVEMSALIMEAMAFLGEEMLRPAIYDITLNGKIAQDKESSEMLEIIYSDIYFDLNSCFDFGGSAVCARNYIIGRSADTFISDYTALLTKAEQKMQELIDALSSETAKADS